MKSFIKNNIWCNKLLLRIDVATFSILTVVYLSVIVDVSVTV